jgi:molecular chaperone DnaK (HSP70)
MSGERIWGIDLGTTNSVIALVDPATAQPAVMKNDDGKDTTPSVVSFERQADGSEQVVVGEAPKRNLPAAPKTTCAWVKRQMGKNTDEFEFLGRTAEEVSAHVLKYLVDYGHRSLGVEKPEAPDVVITVPAYFREPEKRATRAAGKIAGLNVRDLVHEPVAAAIAYGHARLKEKKNVIVFDLGGGTLDVTVMTVQPGERFRAEVHGSFGSRDLGGKDWDERLIELITSKFSEEHGFVLDDAKSPILRLKLHEEAENAKHLLSTVTSQKVTLLVDGKGLRVEITRQQFEEFTKALLDQAMRDMERAIEHAGKQGLKIDEILLVGGSSRMPAVPRTIKERFGFEAKLHDPDLAIAKGAAIYGEMLRKGEVVTDDTGLHADRVATSAVRNVTPHAIGIGLLRDGDDPKSYFVRQVIAPQSKIPATNETTVYTIRENQTRVEFEIFESREAGPSEIPAENELIHSKSIDTPPRLPKESPLIVTTALDSSGVLHLHIKEPKSGQQWEIEVLREGSLTQEELLKAAHRVAVAV